MKRTNTTTRETTRTPVAEGNDRRSYFDLVLDKVKYVGDGNAPDGSAFIIEDDEIALGLTALEWLGYEVAKKFVTSRDYLPDEYMDAARRLRRVTLGTESRPTFTPFYASGVAAVDDLREAVKCSLLTSLRADDRKNAIANAFKALDAEITHDKFEARNYKTLPKEEVLCPVDIGLVEALIAGRTSYEVRWDEGVVSTYEVSPALTAIFEGVKAAHQYAFKPSAGADLCTRWAAFQCFALNISGKEIASRLAISEQRVSELNRTTCQWLLDEVKKLDLDALTAAHNDLKVVAALRWIATAA